MDLRALHARDQGERRDPRLPERCEQAFTVVVRLEHALTEPSRRRVGDLELDEGHAAPDRGEREAEHFSRPRPLASIMRLAPQSAQKLPCRAEHDLDEQELAAVLAGHGCIAERATARPDSPVCRG